MNAYSQTSAEAAAAKDEKGQETDETVEDHHTLFMPAWPDLTEEPRKIGSRVTPPLRSLASADVPPTTDALVKPIGININKVHEYYPWSRSTTYVLVRDGLIPARKLGRSTIILTADLDRFVAELPEVAS